MIILMTRVSFNEERFGQYELQEIRTGFPANLVLPVSEVTDTKYSAVFEDAIERLGLTSVDTTYNPDTGAMELVAPEGFMFRMTGAFQLWPAGNSLDWGYGPPTYSFEYGSKERQTRIDELIEGGMHPDSAKELVMRDAGDDKYLDLELEYYHGTSIALSFNYVQWGASVPALDRDSSSSDDNPPEVKVTLNGFKTIWHEQARRFVKLPNSDNDRLLQVHEYGEPGVIPCWKGSYVEGSIDDIQLELVPVRNEDRDTYLMPLKLLWVPERVRWSVYSDFPKLIDQGMDYAARTNYGTAMRMLGSIATAFGGREGNVFDEIVAEDGIVVIEDPMVAHMDTDKLVAEIEKLIDELNSCELPENSQEIKQREDEEYTLAESRKRLMVLTDVTQTLHALVREFGQSDDLLIKHAKYTSAPF